MANAINFRINVSFFSGSFNSCIVFKLNTLLTNNTKNGRVAARAATNDIDLISVALVSEIDAIGAMEKSATSINAIVWPLRINASISIILFGLARTPKTVAIAVDRIAYAIQTFSPLSKAALAKMLDKAVSKLATTKIESA